MAALEDLIAQVENPELRERLSQEAGRLLKRKKFGMVFEEHLPECTPLYDVPVRAGRKAALKAGSVNDLYRVLAVKDGRAKCLHLSDKAPAEFAAEDLVTVAEFGEPIYPYLKPIDSVEHAPDSDLWHTLIEADNYHALQLLEYLYAGAVDCIYIDPPYNTGAKDWKYNNDYVDASDSYRHSKWLSMMQKRLALAKKLLNPKDGVLICAIDDYELAHLLLLFEEIFAEYDRNIVVVNHHPQGGASDNISRTHEYAIFLTPTGESVIRGNKTENLEESWSLMRGGTDRRNLRIGRPNSFYGIYVDKNTLRVVGVGQKLSADADYSYSAPDNCFALYPVGKDGTERVWRYEHGSMKKHIEAGEIICTKQKTLKVIKPRDVKYQSVFSVWTDGKYNAGTQGTAMIANIFSGSTRFSYPKSLYAVSDAIGCVVKTKPNALILDFFAGSGTTLHAVNLLNAEDGGHRRCILVTNNEVSADEAKRLTADGFRPGDEEWEKLGIARYVTWPRTVCSIEGHDVNGNPLKGNYLGTDRPMADGFPANAAYFKLGFLDKTAVALGRQLRELLPVLWMKAGAVGPCSALSEEAGDFLLFPRNGFALLLEERAFSAFEEALAREPGIGTVYFVTDYEAGYRAMAAWLPGRRTFQLYRDYLDNFRINRGRGV